MQHVLLCVLRLSHAACMTLCIGTLTPAWAARYNPCLLITLPPKGGVLSFLFFFFFT